MLHGNGTNAAQNNTFLDSSTNNFTITRNGNTTQGSFSPFSQTGWSTYINANGNYFTSGTSAGFGFGTGDFTFEFFIYIVGFADNQFLIDFRPSGGASSTKPWLYLNTSGTLIYGTSGANQITGGTVAGNTWLHVAVSRVSGSTRMFLNGVQVGSTYVDANNYGTSERFVVGTFGDAPGATTSNGGTVIGYMSNLRVLKGTGLYSSNFSVPTTALTAITNTSVLTFQSNRWVDNSANLITITPSGTPSIQAFSPFVPAYITPTTYSNWFDGSGDYLTVPDNANLELGSGDFTIECWINTTVSNGGYVTAVSKWGSSNQSYMIRAASTDIGSGWSFFYSTNGSNYFTVFGSSINDGGWHHVAVTRSGNVFTTFTDGVLKNTTTDAVTLYNGTSSVTIGAGDAGANPFTGVISNLRIVKGTALYTASFTPPTAPLTAITNTQLLTCQSSTFIDNSTNAFTITAAGNTLPVTSPTPFPAKVDTTTLNSAYSTSLIGGSYYGDGSGDYLTAPSDTAFDFTSTNATIECWFYCNSLSNPFQLFGFNNGTSDNKWLGAYVETNGSIKGAASAGLAPGYVTATGLIKTGTWYHLAWVLNSTAFTLYLNGVSVATETKSNVYAYNSGSPLIIGRLDGINSYCLNGYMSSLRIVKGTARYTSNFAPPVAPLTNVTNTSLLLNYTNGAIFDNTAKNVLETVGNAQISTTQSKWGGSSMKFDGTGDWLYQPYSVLFPFGTGDFTIEWWMNPDASQNNLSGIFNFQSGTTYFIAHNNITSYPNLITVFVDAYGAGTRVLTGTTTLSAGTWYHVAITRASGTWRLFVNGFIEGSTYSNSADPVPSNSTFYVGQGNATGYKGYIDDMRVTKGVARYITNFTPPTSQLQDQ
jgi:hypothetical protein